MAVPSWAFRRFASLPWRPNRLLATSGVCFRPNAYSAAVTARARPAAAVSRSPAGRGGDILGFAPTFLRSLRVLGCRGRRHSPLNLLQLVMSPLRGGPGVNLPKTGECQVLL